MSQTMTDIWLMHSWYIAGVHTLSLPMQRVTACEKVSGVRSLKDKSKRDDGHQMERPRKRGAVWGFSRTEKPGVEKGG